MEKTLFKIDQMDCRAEEQMIRLALAENPKVRQLDFDIGKRSLSILHDGDLQNIQARINKLNLGSSLIATETTTDIAAVEPHSDNHLLWIALAINLAFFIIEAVSGWLAGSVSLLADSLDMFADAFVYGISIYALAGTLLLKKRIAALGGYLQLALAIWGFVEVARRFYSPEAEPSALIMMIVSLTALIANTATLRILNRSKSGEVTIKASQICTSNDVIANMGVILAGGLVWVTHSKIPDLVVGTIVFILIVRASIRMIQLSR